MASTSSNNGSSKTASNKPKSSGSARATAKRSTPAKRRAGANNSRSRTANYARAIRNRAHDVPTWVATLASVVGVGVAVGAGLFATRNQWMPKAREWADDFNAAYADDETDRDNFDQTRGAGRDAMRDDPGEWDDIDDLSDASFPASDPPSFSPTKI